MLRLTRKTPRLVRFESNAETLRFPEGGVFGPSSSGSLAEGDEVAAAIHRMRIQLDDLRRDVDVVMHLPRGDTWRPRAA